MATTTSSFAAKVDSGVAAVREWQRGAMTWAECLRRVDVTGKGEKALAVLSSESNEAAVRQAVTAACGAGN